MERFRGKGRSWRSRSLAPWNPVMRADAQKGPNLPELTQLGSGRAKTGGKVLRPPSGQPPSVETRGLAESTPATVQRALAPVAFWALPPGPRSRGWGASSLGLWAQPRSAWGDNSFFEGRRCVIKFHDNLQSTPLLLRVDFDGNNVLNVTS